ncbi:MAG: helix-turn-helix domain-containing protein [Chloroflexi bacterium]|nr:helix-turn-helix domain-containing protein [Chloroflexota bacterium]
MTSRKRPEWDAEAVRALRAHLGATQGELAEELGVRQQTVSEWETSAYRPRGASAKLLSMVAEQADFSYVAESSVQGERASAPPADAPSDKSEDENEDDGDAAR